MLTQKKITIKIKDLAKNYVDNSNTYGSVVGYNNKLNIRPSYQREFVYKDKTRNAVIDSVLGGYDIGKFTWGTSDSGYEVIDGQQRTISICQFVNGDYSIPYCGKDVYYHNLSIDEKERFDNYEIDVVVCDGSQNEKLEWFKRVNIAGEKLTEQELRNAAYPSVWLEDAKRFFSKPNCNAQKLYSKYLKGTPIRQDYLETVLCWFADKNGIGIETCMSENSTKLDASELKDYVEKVFDWVDTLFPNYHKEMLGLNWGILYNKYYHNYYSDAKKKEIADKVESLFLDDEITNHKGIFEYVLSDCDENLVKLLSIRAFDLTTKKYVFAKQNGCCACCGKKIKFEDAQAHHREKWVLGGKTVAENCDMVCEDCHKKELH